MFELIVQRIENCYREKISINAGCLRYGFVSSFFCPALIKLFPIIHFLQDITITESIKYRQIDGRLHTVGDTVLIVDLRYNGTILLFTPNFVRVIPHDYGHPIRRSPRKLRSASGITHGQRSHLLSIGIVINDEKNIFGGTFPAHGCPNHNITFDENSLSQYYFFCHYCSLGYRHNVNYEYK